MLSQSEDEKLPVEFLEDEPVNEDELGLHAHIAENIENIIAKDSVKKKTIGLFGQWGSGKSSIIDIFSKNYQDDKNKIITYDSWAHRGDLLKRSFLLKLARELKVENENFEDEITIQDHLTKKKISKNFKITGNKPENWVIFLSGLIIFAFLLRMLGVSFSRDVLFGPLFHLPLLKNLPYISNVENIFMIVLIVCFFSFIIIFFIRRKKILEKIKQFMNYYLGKNIDLTENHLTQEDLEFSSDFYQRCFDFIINPENKNSDGYENIIIVFDNLDRVDEDTVLDVLSMLQLSVQNDANEKSKSWFIVPIDKDRLSGILSKQFKNTGNNNVIENNKETYNNKTPENDTISDNNENLVGNNDIGNNKDGLREANDFIEKIFQFRIEIPPINESDWRSLYKEKFFKIFKFYDRNKDEDKQIFTRRIFESFTKYNGNSYFLTPREIISFLNDLGINYLFWKDDIPITLQSLYLALKKYDLNDDFFNQEDLRCKIIGKAKFVYNIFDEYEVYEAILKQHYKSDNIIDLFVNKAKELLEKNEYNSLNKIIKNLDSSKKSRLMERVLEVSEDELTKDINIISNYIKTIEDSDLKKEGKKYYKEIIAKIDDHINNGTIEGLSPDDIEGICIILKENKDFKK
ncbi:P-loop NTPase fold protein, partial [Flexistipes sp.]|uniref:P-loop NTPase fold protein n=1 Tax=Flexistipes sp. TaxID=3088135 RepID=UPI002E210530|nr:P-loop NTPase fold protein [Flexistipes sp.]